MNDRPDSSAAASPDDFLARYYAHEARAAELHPANKVSLMAALQAAGIALVTVNFDGCADSGQIEDISSFGEDNAEMAFSDTVTVDLQKASFGADAPHTISQPLRDAVETLSYALLETSHGGWEINEGAYGEFTFDVAAGTITLDFNQRIESSEHYGHEW